MDEIRKKEHERVAVKPGTPANPLRDDPYRLFQTYPSLLLNPQTKVAIEDLNRSAWIEQSPMAQVGQELRLNPIQTQTILESLKTNSGVRIADLQAMEPGGNPTALYQTLGWLLKMGVIEIV